MAAFAETLRHEVRILLPVTLYFLAGFELLALTQALMLEEFGIRASSFASAALGALVVAKVVLIADRFAFVDRFPHKPIACNAAWKTAVYFAGSVVVRYFEHVAHHWPDEGGFAEANRRLAAEVVWPHVLCVQLWLLVLLAVFCSWRELARALGPGRLRAVFFSERRTGGSAG